jgi:hypothetical protein
MKKATHDVVELGLGVKMESILPLLGKVIGHHRNSNDWAFKS